VHAYVILLNNMKHVYYATSNEAKFTDAKIFLSELNPELTIEQLAIEVTRKDIEEIFHKSK
jgi:hypothetical protein